MDHRSASLSVLFSLALTFSWHARSSAAESGGADRPQKPGSEKSSASTNAVEQAELEQKFKETMANATLVGRWCSVADGKLGEERDEKYTIQSANKLSGDQWVIFARVQYGKKDVTLPVPVQVKWAGDTPVISITNLGLPGLGTYTARVLIYDKTYSGTWSGSNHGGLLHGIIKKSN